MTRGSSDSSGPLRADGTGTLIDLRVIPRSPKNLVGGVRDHRLLVRVTAPPVEQAANAAVVAVIADVLDVPKGQVRLATGQTSRNKSVAVAGLSMAEVRQRLGRSRLPD